MKEKYSLSTSYVSNKPHISYSKKAMLFGQFEGLWDIDIEFFDDDGESVFSGVGEWCFSWVLDGRILQDVLIYPDLKDPTKTQPGERNIGTSVRQYDAKTDKWRVVWFGASSGNFCILNVKEANGDELLLERNDDNSSYLRWKFSNITADSFHWTGHYSKDKGETWILEQEMFARRRT